MALVFPTNYSYKKREGVKPFSFTKIPKKTLGTFSVSLSFDLSGLRREDTGETIPKAQFTPEMKSVYQDLRNQRFYGLPPASEAPTISEYKGPSLPEPTLKERLGAMEEVTEKLRPVEKLRFPFAKEPTEIIKGLGPIKIVSGAVFRFLEAIPRATIQMVQNVKELQKLGKAEPLKISFDIDAGRLGFEEPEIKSTFRKMSDEFNRQNEINPPQSNADLARNSAIAALKEGLPDVLDLWIAGSQIELGAKIILKATKYDPILERSLSELGLPRDKAFTQADLINRTKVSMKASKTGVEYINAIKSGRYIASKIKVGGKGVPNLNKFFRKIQDVARDIVLPIEQAGMGFQVRPIALAPGLPGYERVAPIGFTIQKRVGSEITRKATMAKSVEIFAKSLTTKEIAKITAEKLTAKVVFDAISKEAIKGVPEAIKPEKGIIPKELEPLAKEARKYKSAGEFEKGIRKIATPLAEGLPRGIKDLTKEERALREQIVAPSIKETTPLLEAFGKFQGEKTTEEALKDFYTQALKPVKEVKKPVSKFLPAELVKKPAPFIRKRETTLLKDRIRNIVRGAREGRITTKQEIEATQTELLDILDKSNLELLDKAKFRKTIKNIQTEEQLKSELPEIKNRIVKLEQAELSRGIQSQISRELKYVKPVKVGQKRVAKYDYQTNKFLEGLRKDNKINQEQAQLKLNEIPTDGLSELDKIEARFLSLKANGAKASVLLHEQVLADIRNLKEIGETAKDDADFIKKIEKQEKVDEVLKGVNQQKRVLKKLGDVYISSIANLYSTINTIAGKKIADKYDYGSFQTNSQYSFSEQVDKVTNKAKKIYGLKNNRQLSNVFIGELAPTNWTIIDTTGLKTEINRFNLIDIYNAIKNDLIRERYNNAFGEEQVDALLQNLTEEDVKLADYLMDEVQRYRDILNQRSIETTGRDLGEVENYWPSTSEYEVDFYDDIRTQGETPSAMKGRAKSSKVFPRIDNAWLKFQKHIAQGEHVKTISKKYEELKNLFSNRIVKNTIKNKFGDESYTALIDHIETFSLNKRVQLLDIFSGAYSAALNNWVKAKIASPTVLARQLISSVYSVEKVGAKNFLKYQSEVVKNPAKTFNYMWKNIPFLRIRFKQGYSEALQDAIKGTSNLKVGMDSITKYVTFATRGGDITAILINGYPIVKTEMAKHGNMEKAIEEFQKFTEKTQQSGTRANMSRLQRERNAFARTFFRFKNTVNQLLRLQTDATVQFLNKQISAQKFATKTALYSIYTPMMYVLVGYLITQGFKKVFGTDDEEKEKSLLGNVLAQIIIQPYQALPLVDMAVENAYAEVRKRLTGKGYYFGGGLFSYPLLSDIETAWSKLKKKEPNASDFLRVFSLLQEPITGVPTETILRYYGYTQKKEEERKTYEQIKKGISTSKKSERKSYEEIKRGLK